MSRGLNSFQPEMAIVLVTRVAGAPRKQQRSKVESGDESRPIHAGRDTRALCVSIRSRFDFQRRTALVSIGVPADVFDD